MEKLLALLKKLGAKDEDVEAAKAEIESEKEAEVQGLKAKNAELLKKSREAKEGEGGKVAELEAKIDELSESLAKAKKEGDAAIKKLTTERDEALKAATSEKSAVEQLLIDGGLSAGLNGKLKSPAFLGAVKGLLSKNFVVEADDKNGRKALAVVKDKDGKERKLGVDEYLKEWLASDEGKEFALDQGGSGGGAGGSGSGGAGSTGKRARYEALNAMEPEKMTARDKLELVALAGDPEVAKPA